MGREETARLFRFAVTGLLVAAIYVVLYTIFVRVGMQTLVANTVAFLLAVLFQYLMQTLWTFRGSLRDGQQGMRFAITIAIGILYSSLVTTVIGPKAAWPPWLSAGLVAVTLPVVNYIAFRAWVYRGAE